jgi:uncharacterized membrane protein YphA (DoxX/SURF4 family)
MTFSRSDALRVAAVLLRIALGVVFVYAAWLKLRDPWQMFAMSIDSYQLLPMWAVRVVARTLPLLELLLGVLLLAGLWLRFSAGATSLLLLGFFVLMIRAWAKHMEINCGCFGPGDIISWKTLLRDGSLLAASLFVTAMSAIGPRKAT